MLNESFLTLLDDRIKPSGTRDPLGFQTIWVQLGKELVGENLTTITSSIDNFIITLIACHYSFQKENDEDKMNIFFKVEQLAAYFRIASNNKTNIMGITRANEKYTNDQMQLGSGADAEIFGNQKTSGLWGYYSSALVASGLIDKDKSYTTNAEKIIDEFVKICPLDEFLEKTSISKQTIEENHEKFMEALKRVYEDMANIILNKNKFNIYSDYVLPFFEEKTSNSYIEFFNWMSDQDNDFSQKLQAIKKIDVALWIASKVFDYCRSENKNSIGYIAQIIGRSKISKIILDISENKLKSFTHHWNKGEYEDCVKELIKVHKEAMKTRSSTEWISIMPDDTVKVLVGSSKSLDEFNEGTDDLNNRWQYNYFLYSYLNVAYQVYQKGNG